MNPTHAKTIKNTRLIRITGETERRQIGFVGKYDTSEKAHLARQTA